MAEGARSSKKQRELFDYVDSFIQAHGYGPSYREVMKALDYKSVSTVAIHINSLIAKGYLHKQDNSARSLEVITKSPQVVTRTKAATPAQEKWLVTAINERFDAYAQSPEQRTLDELYVLIGALKILGLDGAHESTKQKLSKVRR